MFQMLIIACAAVGAIGSVVLGQDAKPPTSPTPSQSAKVLTIGDAAPAIDISNWIRGDKVTDFTAGKIYVIEFWTTTSAPSKESMPLVTEVQNRYKDRGVTVIGLSDEPLTTVTAFLESNAGTSGKKWSEIIGFTVATDPDRSVLKSYLLAAGRDRIPCAFVVGKDQHIEWIGHPEEIEKPLDAIANDSWDRAAFKTKWEQEKVARQQAIKDKQAVDEAAKAKNWVSVLEIADRMLKANPKDYNTAVLKFRVLALAQNDVAKAYEFAKPYMQANWDDAMALNDFAWTIVDELPAKDKDFKLAIGAAMQANTLSGEQNPSILDTLARCWFEMDNLAEAVKVQEQAAKLSGDDDVGTEIKATLKKYQDALAKKGG